MTPCATYRLQFHKGFGFAEGARLAPYLAKLGISHLYASPILTARAGSLHGYDVVDHTSVNPELGGEDGYRALVKALRDAGLGIVVDIVPNHMAVGGGRSGADNLLWRDVLRRGRASPAARFFDIDWDDPASPGRMVLPILGAPLSEILASGALRLEAYTGERCFRYGEHRLPLRPEDQADAANGAALNVLLARQHYQLIPWQEAGARINWRRFFDIHTLAGLRIEDGEVFDSVHAAIFRLYGEGLIDGIRVDHVDGLAEPGAYCRRLRARLTEWEAARPFGLERPALIVVEKILADGEDLPPDWPVDGTTGYDFMNEVDALLHDGAKEETFSALWREMSGREGDFDAEETIARRDVLGRNFQGQLRAVARNFARAAPAFSESDYADVLAELIVHYRAYRDYRTPPDRAFLAFEAAARASEPQRGERAKAVLAAMRAVLKRGDRLSADTARRLAQLTAPVAAKAVEDTAFYRYGRLLSRNDVGFSPARFALSTDEFHRRMARRAEGWPKSLLATATHDHKRGEDARARLAALSEFPQEWGAAVRAWRELNARLRPPSLAAGDEYQLYQTLCGVWPLGLAPDDDAGLAHLLERLLRWQRKALREEKCETSWLEPDAAFESVNANFLKALFARNVSGEFLKSLAGFVARIAPGGALNGFTQTVLRNTAPGLPDCFQGCELWDLSLVDPDNRRPVDFALREALLAADAPLSAADWRNGEAKFALLRRLLALRARLPECFAHGAYRAVAAQGPNSAHVAAFLRAYGGAAVLVAVPHLCAHQCTDEPRLPAAYWRDTRLVLPDGFRARNWIDALNESESPKGGSAVACDALFARFPAAVLWSKP